MNCKECGKVAMPKATRCKCGAKLVWPVDQQMQTQRARGPMPAIVHRRLIELGLDKHGNETPAQHAERCRAYLFKHLAHAIPKPMADAIARENAAEAIAEREAMRDQ